MQARLDRPYRLLVVDDAASVREEFRETLTPDEPGETNLFVIAEALDTIEAADLVQLSVERNEPFAVAFVDVGQPPHWDGAAGALGLWRIDPGLEIVLCTPSADLSWCPKVGLLHPIDQLAILRRPIVAPELRQLAMLSTMKWAHERRSRAVLDALDTTKQLVADFADELDAPVARLRENVASVGRAFSDLQGLCRTAMQCCPDCEHATRQKLAPALQVDPSGTLNAVVHSVDRIAQDVRRLAQQAASQEELARP